MTKNIEKKELTLDDIRFYGTGGIDVNSEWNWSGNYEMTLDRNLKSIDYNFFAKISRKYSSRGRSTIGWYVSLYMTFHYSNGHDIKLLETQVKTLKLAKKTILDKIKEVHNDKVGTESLIEKWKNTCAKPVFALEESGEPILIGTTYDSSSFDFDKVLVGTNERYLWYNDDLPDYKNHSVIYQLNLSFYWNEPAQFSVWKTQRSWGGYTGTSEHNQELIQKMIQLVENHDKYRWMFEKIKEVKERIEANQSTAV